MLSVAPAARFLLDHETQDEPFFSFPDVEFSSWDFPSLISEPVTSDPISSESNKNSPNSTESNHGSIHSTEPKIEPSELVLELTERKLKRMKSNRESAQRSRMRKKERLENLRNEMNQLNYTNKDLSDRLRFAHHIGMTIRSENQRLRTEHSLLRQRLIELQNMLIFRQIHQMNNHKNNNFGGFGITRMNETMGI